jgi:hypothetical protein
MSKEFFDTMEKIEALAKRIKFLEGAHPEIYNKYQQPAIEALKALDKLDKEISKDLKAKSKSSRPRTRRQ